MKRIFGFLAALLLVANVSFAQQQAGDKTIGAQLGWGEHKGGLSLGAQFTYAIDSHFRLAPSANYNFKNDHVSGFDLNADLHYLIGVGNGNKMAVYPLAGLTFQSWKVSYDYVVGPNKVSVDNTDSKFGLNLGCGFQYDINDQWRPFAEAKYSIVSDYNQFFMHVGMAYVF